MDHPYEATVVLTNRMINSHFGQWHLPTNRKDFLIWVQSQILDAYRRYHIDRTTGS